MRDLNDLYFFVQVVDHGGFAPAARALNLQKSRLSRRIQLLEERLGVRLLNRSSRHFSVAEVGRNYHEHCQAMLVQAEAADQVVAQLHAEPRGVLRVSCPVALLSFQFGNLIARFMAMHPALQIHLEGTNRRVDPVGEAIDIAIRVRFPPIESSGLVMRQLDISPQCLVARPGLVDAPVRSPENLAQWPSLDLGPPRGTHQWLLATEDGRSVVLSHQPRLVTDDLATLREAALAGVGIAKLPKLMVSRDVAAGRLVTLLPEWRPQAGIVHAVFPSRRGLLPSVRQFLDFLAAACKEQRQQTPNLGAE